MASPFNLENLSSSIQNAFKKNQQILSFEEFVRSVEEKPRAYLRGSAQYTADLLDRSSKEIFQPADEHEPFRVIGQEGVQKQLYNALQGFARIGANNRLILLHGPNGSSKSTIIGALMRGLEKYSRTTDGALYTFSWIFPVDRIVRGSLGIRVEGDRKNSSLNTFAYLSEEDIACVIPSELRDHPILLMPQEQRTEFFKTLDLPKDSDFRIPSRLLEGGLSHRDHLIYQALLNSYQGDYSQVLRHIRIERFYLSRVYRTGLVTVEPQMHVDAQYQQLTLNRSLSQIPASLQGLNLFSITGDLAESNRGIVDYNDLLKRPIESFKYLLSACETGKISIGHAIVHLDTVFIGSSNELQLDSFKEYPDFSSFKGRIELIRVPYLVNLSQEEKIYQPMLKSIAGEKPISPHVVWAAVFWGILTRLKKPHRERYPSELAQIIDKLTPLDKLRVYDSGEMPERFSNEERKLLRANVNRLHEEFASSVYYEGRTGASAREIKSILIDAAQNPDFKTLSPLAVTQELKKFVKRTSEYEFLRQDPVDGYHHHEAFIEIMLNEYAMMVDREVRDCLGLYETKQWSDFMKKYITHLSALLRKEKIKNSITGAYEEADQNLLNEFELIAGAPVEVSARDQFRLNLITQIGAWSLDHANEPIDYFKVFPEIKQRIERHFYESQKTLLQKMNTALKQFGTDYEDPSSEGTKLAKQTIQNMQTKFGYSMDGAKEVIGFLMSRKY